jgi:hypothetical protein
VCVCVCGWFEKRTKEKEQLLCRPPGNKAMK